MLRVSNDATALLAADKDETWARDQGACVMQITLYVFVKRPRTPFAITPYLAPDPHVVRIASAANIYRSQIDRKPTSKRPHSARVAWPRAGKFSRGSMGGSPPGGPKSEAKAVLNFVPKRAVWVRFRAASGATDRLGTFKIGFLLNIGAGCTISRPAPTG